MSTVETVTRQRCECGFIGTEYRMAEHHRDNGHTSSQTVRISRDRTEHRRRQKQRRSVKPTPEQIAQVPDPNRDLEQKLRALRRAD